MQEIIARFYKPTSPARQRLNDKLGRKKERRKMTTVTLAKVEDIISGKEKCPLPLEVIPNNMGINLVGVETIRWEKQDDGQLINLTINFIPSPKE